jgi:hypothetical protein
LFECSQIGDLSLFLEVIGHADDRLADVVPALGRNWVPIAECRHLGHPAAILGANIEAGADLVGKSGSVDAADFSLLFYVERRGPELTMGKKMKPPGPPSTNGLKFLKTKDLT